MGSRLRILILFALVFLSIYGIASASLPNAQTGSISLSGPTECPRAGCAAGQRLNFTVEYALGVYDADSDPNVAVCVYASPQWKDPSSDPDGIRLPGANGLTGVGGMSGSTYTLDQENHSDRCVDPPPGYDFLGRATAKLGANKIGDFIGFSFRINPAAITNGSVVVQVYEDTEPGANSTWKRTLQVFKNLTIVPTAANVFVANDAAECVGNSPCYLNGNEDFGAGFGTGLKDAADSVPAGATITVLGGYTIKSQTVIIDKPSGGSPLVIRGVNNASLSSAAASCGNPMIDIRTGATLTGLAIQGACGATPRDLLRINSLSDVTLESDDLTGGKDAVRIGDFAGNVLVRFSNITGNSGYAILADASSGSAGSLTAIANNLVSNRNGPQVECNARGAANHNFWGAGILPSAVASNCQAGDPKRLGAAIQHNASGPGADAREISQVPAGPNREYAFNGQIGYRYNGGASNFGLFIVNHGSPASASVPFSTTGLADVTPCSNYWDIFLKDGAAIAPDASLDLFIKYDSSAACINAVESVVYCANPSPVPPLWWLDPSGAAPLTWVLSASGSNPQETACDLNENELKLTVDTTGRPNFATDLFFTPLLVGVGPLATSTPSATFTATVSRTATITNTPTITFTPTVTRTRTATLTRTPTRTYTPYVYRSPTSVYKSPTPIRTKTPTPNSQTQTVQARITPSVTSASTSYAASTDGSGYPAPEGDVTGTSQPSGSEPTSDGQVTTTSEAYPAGGTPIPGSIDVPGTSQPVTMTATQAAANGTAAPGQVPTLAPMKSPSQPLLPPKTSLGFWARLGMGGFLGTAFLTIAGWFFFVKRALK